MIDELLKLSDGQLYSLGVALREQRLAQPFSISRLERLLPGAQAAVLAETLSNLATVGGFSDRALAVFVEGIIRDRDLRTVQGPSVELVATGPDVPGLVYRETSVVVHDLFAHADSSVLIAGFVVYQGQRVFRALSDRMLKLPQLSVRLFLDVRRAPGDTCTAKEVVTRFIDKFRRDEWPENSPLPQVFFDTRSLEPTSSGRSSLHAKCVVVDQETTMISSANFTEAAQERNIEMGLLTRETQIARQVTLFFDRLVDNRLLERVL